VVAPDSPVHPGDPTTGPSAPETGPQPPSGARADRADADADGEDRADGTDRTDPTDPTDPTDRNADSGDDGDPEGPAFTPVTRKVIGAGVVLVMVAALVLRFWTRSDLWLDEALTVNIARLPIHEIPSFLRRDGAPPLFYVLLHFWMGLFGTSDVAVRSLSGVFGVVTLPLAWLAGKRLAGPKAGWAAMLLVASSPFATRYDTETRMYSLVVLLTVLGFLALDRSLHHPRPGNLIAVGAVTGLLLYTHYWSLYLIGVTLLWLAWVAWRGRPAWRRGARASLVAAAVGCLTFVPWLPTFLFQSKHTGTPWATPANFAAMVNAVSSFAGGSTSQGRALALIFFALAGLGLFGLATDRRHIDVDIRTRPLGRPLAVALLGTLAAAIAGGFLTNSAFDARYASVVFIPLILLVAVGLTTFRDRRIRAVILTLAVIAGLAGSVTNITTNRTQAGQVAAAIARTGHAGDIVAYCPDQLGPAVNRLLPAGRYQQTTFPRGTGPEFVDWVDYGAATAKGDPLTFAQHLESLAQSSGRQIFLVWAPGYQTYGVKCEGIVQTLQNDPHYTPQALVGANSVSFYQPMSLVRFTPVG
jgi:4-amino-4-deoxy-L-arabinose transferase-like glycosyltransferase